MIAKSATLPPPAAEPEPPSVHSQSTSLQRTPVRGYKAHLLANHEPAYYAAHRLYAALESTQNDGTLDRFENCHTFATFAWHRDTGRIVVLANSCHLRFCPLCNQARSASISQNVEIWLDNQVHPKLVTLTLRSSDDALSDQLNRLYAAFSRLRRRKLFRDATPGGIWFFQVTYNEQLKQWHPHIHALTAGKFIPQGELSRQWEQITGDSNIVDIRAINRNIDAARHAARYATMPGKISDLTLDKAQELHFAIYTRHICGTWGTAHEQKLTKRPDYEPGQWKKLLSWDQMLLLAGTDDAARDVVMAWSTDQPMDYEPDFWEIHCFLHDLPPPCDDLVPEKIKYDPSFSF